MKLGETVAVRENCGELVGVVLVGVSISWSLINVPETSNVEGGEKQYPSSTVPETEVPFCDRRANEDIVTTAGFPFESSR
jgi:hypothetical protein